jgi:hypothetical protein
MLGLSMRCNASVHVHTVVHAKLRNGLMVAYILANSILDVSMNNTVVCYGRIQLGETPCIVILRFGAILVSVKPSNLKRKVTLKQKVVVIV